MYKFSFHYQVYKTNGGTDGQDLITGIFSVVAPSHPAALPEMLQGLGEVFPRGDGYQYKGYTFCGIEKMPEMKAAA